MVRPMEIDQRRPRVPLEVSVSVGEVEELRQVRKGDGKTGSNAIVERSRRNKADLRKEGGRRNSPE